MNAHDSERIKGMLESLGLGEAAVQEDADVVVFNTCTIREKPDQRLAAHLAQAKALKARDPERVIAVGGCETSRRSGEILAEIEQLARDGVREVTLLGQNVNSYGRDLPVDARTGFAELLRAVDAVKGIERIRFTSPHPKDFRPDVIEAMAGCAAVCEHAHLPLQSGSTRVLKRMRRTYSRERYLRLAAELRAAIPDLALTTDLIVGFPGETEEDFLETVGAVEEVGYEGAFTFVFSPRNGTEAAMMPDQVPDGAKRDRIERLIEVVQRAAAVRNAE